jgi:endonuclease/exonuclease/phosphatase family metal-dependent hydrolase
MIATSDKRQASVTITVMSFNIRHCEGIDGAIDVERIAKVIAGAKPDLVALQEVDRGVARSARRDMPAEIAALTGMNVAFYDNIVLEGGEYGNAVLSRFKIKEHSNTLLTMLGEGEQRGAIRTVISVPIGNGAERDVAFIATHLDHRDDDAERVVSVDELLALAMATEQLATIIAGDFNALPNSMVHKKMSSLFRDAWKSVGSGDGFTNPADDPVQRIDYIWVSTKVTPVSMEVLPTLASDHYAVTSRLVIC